MKKSVETRSTSKLPTGKETDKNASLPPRAKSVFSRPSKPQTRTLRTTMETATTPSQPGQQNHSNGRLHKTQSDTSLVSGMRRLTVRDRTSNGSATPTNNHRRRVGSARGCRTLEDIAEYILANDVKNVVVMAGAGISTASGIPDFRSPGTGLYDNLRQYKVPYPEAIFDIEYFEHKPRPFFTLAKELYPCGKWRPNMAHYFLRLLHERGILLRIYTQNIDGLERIAGIPAAKLVEAHGNFHSASCIKCKKSHPPEEVKDAILDVKIPRCKDNACYGLVKPDIVFFGEDLPRRFYYYLKDFPQADLLLVMGTSLEVEPFASIVDSVRFPVPRVLFNRKAVGPFEVRRRMNDVVAAGDIRKRVRVLARLLGWDTQLLDLMEKHEPSTKPVSEESESDEDANQNEQLSTAPSRGGAATNTTLPNGAIKNNASGTHGNKPGSRVRLQPLGKQGRPASGAGSEPPGSESRPSPSSSTSYRHRLSQPTALPPHRRRPPVIAKRTNPPRDGRNSVRVNNKQNNNVNNNRSELPHLTRRPGPLPTFHSQRALYRSARNGYGAQVVSSDSDSGDSTNTDSSDGD